MTSKRSRYEASTCQIRRAQWSEYAPIFIKALGLTKEEEMTEITSIGNIASEYIQEFTYKDSKRSLTVSFNLMIESDLLILSYSIFYEYDQC